MAPLSSLRLTTEQALDALHCSRSSLYRLVRAGKLSKPILPGCKQSPSHAGEIEALLA